ncbi:MAG: TlpA family protein disulfide reductase [Chloroflexi bacterium]|nr:TlpA family protein disulfide reductase [Chloroflexota bacterium]
MGPRFTLVAGLIAGAATAVAILVGAVLLIPDPGPSTVIPPSPEASIQSPAPSAPSVPSASQASPTESVQITVGTVAFHVGEVAPALSVPQLGGGQIDLANLQGRPVWIYFVQTTCPTCVDEFPLMNGFAARYADAGLVVIAIDVREDESLVLSFVNSLNALFPIGLDADGAAAGRWDAGVLPVHFWVDRDGIIRAGALGGIGPDVMARNLATILPGIDVTP